MRAQIHQRMGNPFTGVLQVTPVKITVGLLADEDIQSDIVRGSIGPKTLDRAQKN